MLLWLSSLMQVDMVCAVNRERVSITFVEYTLPQCALTARTPPHISGVAAHSNALNAGIKHMSMSNVKYYYTIIRYNSKS